MECISKQRKYIYSENKRNRILYIHTRHNETFLTHRRRKSKNTFTQSNMTHEQIRLDKEIDHLGF